MTQSNATFEEARRKRLLSNFGEHRKFNKKGQPIIRIQAWCYLCSAEHRFEEVCVGHVRREMPNRRICANCGKAYIAGRLDRGRFCDPVCREEARKR